MEIIPNLKDFTKKCKTNNLIVFSSKMYCDYLTPLSIYHSIKKIAKGESFLLESVEGQEKVSRFSFIGFKPLARLKSKGKKIYTNISGEKSEFLTNKDPLYELRKFMKKFCVWPKEHIRFFWRVCRLSRV